MADVVWTGGAERDLLEVFAQLEEQQGGRGGKLIEQIDHRLILLRRFPHLGRVWMQPVRRLLIGTTGFAVFYTVEARGLIIQAVGRLSQSPDELRRELRKRLRLN